MEAIATIQYAYLACPFNQERAVRQYGSTQSSLICLKVARGETQSLLLASILMLLLTFVRPPRSAG